MTVLQFPSPKMDRRRPENRLRRATQEAEDLEERQILYWLALADTALEQLEERTARREPA